MSEWMKLPKEYEELTMSQIANIDLRLVERYRNDPVFFALVNTFEAGLRGKKFTTGDLSQAIEVAYEKIQGKP